jgi:hypothetical protein
MKIEFWLCTEIPPNIDVAMTMPTAGTDALRVRDYGEDAQVENRDTFSTACTVSESSMKVTYLNPNHNE